MRAHVIENGVVINTLEVESLGFLPGLVDGEKCGSLGDLWDGEQFTSPSASIHVPESITPRQGRIALAQAGILTQVDAFFSALNGDGAEVARIEWEYAQEWRRDWPALIAAATTFGLSVAQIDQMFVAAAGI